jgi:hypothetical protein
MVLKLLLCTVLLALAGFGIAQTKLGKPISNSAAPAVPRITNRVIVEPSQPIINNLPAPKSSGLDLPTEVTRFISTLFAAYIGYLVAMKSVDKKAMIDKEVEKTRQQSQIHKDRADNLATVIGKIFEFSAAANRTNVACTVWHSYEASNAVNAEQKRQDFFLERLKLREQLALLLSESEKYGTLPNKTAVADFQLTTYVEQWAELMFIQATQNHSNRDTFGAQSSSIVADLRKLKLFEDQAREKPTETAGNGKKTQGNAESEAKVLSEFTWIKDGIITPGV